MEIEQEDIIEHDDLFTLVVKGFQNDFWRWVNYV
jgi:hypothetical protein